MSYNLVLLVPKIKKVSLSMIILGTEVQVCSEQQPLWQWIMYNFYLTPENSNSNRVLYTPGDLVMCHSNKRQSTGVPTWRAIERAVDGQARSCFRLLLTSIIDFFFFESVVSTIPC